MYKHIEMVVNYETRKITFFRIAFVERDCVCVQILANWYSQILLEVRPEVNV